MVKKITIFLAVVGTALTAHLAWTEPSYSVYIPFVQHPQVPIPNSLYLGIGACLNQEMDAVFVTNQQFQVYYDESSDEKSSPYAGRLGCVNGSFAQPFYFHDLQNSEAVLSLQNEIAGWAFKLDESREKLYVAVLEWITDTQTLVNPVYEISLESLAYQELWWNEIGPGSAYDGVDGAAAITQVQGSYLVVSLSQCYTCDGSGPSATLVLNTQSKVEKFLGEVGNVSLDLDAGTVSYQSLFPEIELCEPSPGCGPDGTRIIFVPAGEVFVEELPQ